MNNDSKKILVILFFIVIVCVAVFLSIYNMEGSTQTKQGVLSSVVWDDDTTVSLVFTDGFTLHTQYDDTTDASDMSDYLLGWVNQEIIVEYAWYMDMNGYEIIGVRPVE